MINNNEEVYFKYVRLNEYNEILSLEQSIFPWLYTSHDAYMHNIELGEYYKIIYNNNIIGTFNFIHLDNLTTIRKLLIKKEYRRQHIGGMALNFLKERANTIKIYVPKYGEAKQFLLAHEFEYDKDIRNYWKKNKIDAEVYIWRKEHA